MHLLLFVLPLFTYVLGKEGFGPGDQEWDSVEVRSGAHLFYWLYKTTANVSQANEKPLVIWLQGGPGASSTGYGNFAELGPLDHKLEPRNTTWVKDYNVLFVDNPVGTGFSYVEDTKLLARNNTQIAKDFIVLLEGFYKNLPEFIDTPLYIFTESYGGKMGAEIALEIFRAVEDGKLTINFKGVALGDSWISPIDSVLGWGPYLWSVGAVDIDGFKAIQEGALKTKQALEDGKFTEATNLWSELERIIEENTYNIDFYNILTDIFYTSKTKKLFKPGVRDAVDDQIEVIMNGEVKEALGLDITWGAQSSAVFNSLLEDFMKPVTSVVEELLNSTDVKVAVYNGQLDLIVETLGTAQWVDDLSWVGSSSWRKATRDVIVVDDIIQGYYKKADQLTFYWVNRAGHMVPADNTKAMDYILKDFIQ